MDGSSSSCAQRGRAPLEALAAAAAASLASATAARCASRGSCSYATTITCSRVACQTHTHVCGTCQTHTRTSASRAAQHTVRWWLDGGQMVSQASRAHLWPLAVEAQAGPLERIRHHALHLNQGVRNGNEELAMQSRKANQCTETHARPRSLTSTRAQLPGRRVHAFSAACAGKGQGKVARQTSAEGASSAPIASQVVRHAARQPLSAA
jgi:hypothetical protein